MVGAVLGAAGVPNYTGTDAANATTRGRRYYMHFGKQGWEFLRWFDDPIAQGFSKLSMPLQRLLEGAFGRNLAYLDRELPFADKGLAERWMTLAGGSATANLVKAFMPFVANGVATFGDAGIASYFGPVQMGAAQTGIVDRYVKALQRWASNDRSAYAFARSMSKSRKREVFQGMLSDITRDARANGIMNPEELIIRAIGQLTPRYYGRLINGLLDAQFGKDLDARELNKVGRALLRLGASYKSAKDSLEKRLKTMGVSLRSLAPETRVNILAPMRQVFTRPFDY